LLLSAAFSLPFILPIIVLDGLFRGRTWSEIDQRRGAADRGEYRQVATIVSAAFLLYSRPNSFVRNSDMTLLPDAGIETIEDKLKTVLNLRSATVNDIPVLMHMARALAEQQGLAPLMTATAAGWRRDLGQAFGATVAAIKNKPVGMALTVCMPLSGATARMTELVSLYVAPPFRRRGIGTALVRHVLAEARNNKVACVRLTVAKDNDGAIATYVHNGFKATEFEILVAPFASFAAATRV
jgi:ribosomal protein S18 acetylase RimI-like enzyme